MSRNEWKIKLHLSCADKLRSMAGKMHDLTGKAELVRIAEDHEHWAESLGVTTIGDLRTRT